MVQLQKPFVGVQLQEAFAGVPIQLSFFSLVLQVSNSVLNDVVCQSFERCW